MRPLRLTAPLLIALVALPATAQDFNPGGRRTQPQPRPGGRPRPRPRPRPKGPKKPDVNKLIKRYTAIVMSKPHEAFPLQKLSQLYRKRDGNIDKLVSEFEARAAKSGGDQLNARMALAGIYVLAQRRGDAVMILETVAKEKPRLATPRLMLARLAEAKSERAAARKHFEAALPLMKAGVDKERVTRSLMILCIELKDFEAAKGHHKDLVRAAKGSLFVKKELGNELYNRGHYALAEAQFRLMLRASAGDNRAMAPALRDLGKALAKQKKMDEALTVLKRARAIAGKQAGIRAEILALLTDVFREQGKLVELIAVLKAERGRDFQRLATIASLYEETGQVDLALKTYREALKVQPRNIDARVKLVHLLQTAGQLEEAIREYEALIKAAPHNADFVFELAETHIQRGERGKALKLVADLERRTSRDNDVLAAVADFYERIEEKARAIKVLERLAKAGATDPQYIVDLGDRYFQQDDKERAKKTWLRIRTVVRNRARAAALLGEVYLDHDMPVEALRELREAVKLAPTRKRYKKQLASALERTGTGSAGSRSRYNEALRLWQELLKDAGDDALLARECRTHMVSLWSILKQLELKLRPLQQRLDRTPPDLEAGRLLAEVQRRLHKLEDSEKTLRKVVALAPGDEASLLALERVMVMQRDLSGAIEVLKKLVDVNPKRARQYYQRMAQYAAELYRDDDAIAYAARAVELSPNDAQGHYRLGKMYRRRQDTKRAIAEFRKAIKKNDRLFRAHFDLAEMLLSAGSVEDADRLYRHVVRSSRDEEFVMRAARLSMQINLGRGTLESLERELLPVALGNPQKPVYRRLLVELYGAMTLPLVQSARLGSSAAAASARTRLAKIGARAVKPLLDALSDKNHAQQRIAIEVLAYVENRSAGPALFNFSLGQADRELRTRAMVACGALRDPELLDRYRQLLAPEDPDAALAPGDAITVAAAWGVARMGDRHAQGLLLQLLDAPSPDVRALAALGLGLSGDSKHAPKLAALARSPEAGPTSRAAAVYALGELGDGRQRPLLLALTDSSEAQVHLAALLALSRLGSHSQSGKPKPRAASEVAAQGAGLTPEVGRILARSLLGEQPSLRKTAMAAGAALVSGIYRRGGALPTPDGAVTVAEVMRKLAPSGYSRDEQAATLVALRPALTKAALAAVATSPARARLVANLILTDVEALLDGTGKLAAPRQKALAETAEAMAVVSVDGFVALARHPSAEVRKSAVELLASRPEEPAWKALVHVLNDRDAEVSKTALSALRELRQPAIVEAVVRLLKTSKSWSIRVHAARALSRTSASSGSDPKGGGATAAVDEALRHAAAQDEFALVREAALRSLATRGGSVAQKALAAAAGTDAEARIRQLAKELQASGS